MRAIAAGLALSMLALGGAHGGELCVTCAKPDVTYRCVFGDTVAANGDDPRAQVLCVTELAKFGGHETCAFDRRSATACPGALRAVSPPKEAALPPLKPPPIGPALTPAPNPEAPKVDTGPRTVEELAKQTAQSIELGKAGEAVKGTAKAAGEGIGKAGSAVGDAAQKSWRCLASFFSDC